MQRRRHRSACADAFKTYVTDNKAGLDAANRVSFSFEYSDSEDYTIEDALVTAQKISDAMSFPIGVVWSNRDKHVPDSDERLSAHFGLVFKMPKVMPQARPRSFLPNVETAPAGAVSHSGPPATPVRVMSLRLRTPLH